MERACWSTILAFVLFAAARSALAQVDLSGTWTQPPAPDNTTDPYIGDYTGLPINDAARLRADSWTAEKWTQEEHECEPHPADYALRAPGGLRIGPETDPLSQAIVAWHVELYWLNTQRTIFVDSRKAPPASAPYTWQAPSPPAAPLITPQPQSYDPHRRCHILTSHALPQSSPTGLLRWERKGCLETHPARGVGARLSFLDVIRQTPRYNNLFPM